VQASQVVVDQVECKQVAGREVEMQASQVKADQGEGSHLEDNQLISILAWHT
jgi:hypothetical protein